MLIYYQSATTVTK